LAKFNAAGVVEGLDYEFEAFVPGCNGTIREPTDTQITAFLTERQKINAEARRQIEAAGKAIEAAGESGNPEEAIAALDDTEAALEMHRRTADAYAALCSGAPSAADILRLPMRIRVLFYAWLSKEVMNPEAVPGGGSSQVKTLRSVAAG
jgi:hypothetical protein